MPIELQEGPPHTYTPRAHIDLGPDYRSAIVSWPHGYHSSEEDAAFRAAGIATAHLIDAAPAMLAALEEAVTQLEGNADGLIPECNDWRLCQVLRAAIARAQPAQEDEDRPATIVTDALVLLERVERAETFDATEGGTFTLDDGRSFRFSVEPVEMED